MTTLTVTCPTCGKTVTWTADYPDRPFCSERCRLIDLGAWASERYVIAAEEEPVWTDADPDQPPTRH